ncbi:MAG: hypothetical protein FJ144_28100, partial [Deltaproteobacteria bacterium]|nr:hypothetical protein [Deltaproteobacteria bacterium]
MVARARRRSDDARARAGRRARHPLPRRPRERALRRRGADRGRRRDGGTALPAPRTGRGSGAARLRPGTRRPPRGTPVTPNDRAEALAPEQVADLLERLAAARSALAAWPLGERALALGRVADLWLGDEARLAAAAEAIAAETGYAPPMVAELLEATLRQWRAKPLRELIDVALADPHSIATPPDLVVAVLAQNTPGLAIAPTFTALALGSAVLLKCSHGEARFAPLLVRSLREVDATLGGAAAARLWRGGDALEA